MRKLSRALTTTVVLLFTSLAHSSHQHTPTPPQSPSGAWASSDGEIVNFEEDRVLLSSGSTLTVLGLVRREAGEWVLRRQGLQEIWKITPDSGSLRITLDGKERVFRALPDVPAELQLPPARVADPKVLSPEKLAEIQNAISERATKGQSVRQDRSRWPEMAGVDAENTKYLKEIVQEVGWIDLKRFGPQTSRDAFLLVQHSTDLPLMMAALPFIENDFKHSDGAQSFALLYDRLQLSLGRKQLYGTQIGMDKQGNPFLFPVENPEGIDERLKDLGLPSLREYLSEAGKVLFNGKEIQARADE